MHTRLHSKTKAANLPCCMPETQNSNVDSKTTYAGWFPVGEYQDGVLNWVTTEHSLRA